MSQVQKEIQAKMPQTETTASQTLNPISIPAETPNTNTNTTKETTKEPPKLSVHPTTKEKDLIVSLHLIADSVAQQQQLAAKTILSHPVSWTVMLVSSGSVFGMLLYYYKHTNWATVGTTMAGRVILLLVGVRYLVGGYLDLAERVGTWGWLYGDSSSSSGVIGIDNDTNTGIDTSTTSTDAAAAISNMIKEDHDKKDDAENVTVVLVMTFGETIIGTIVLRAIPLSPFNSNNNNNNKNNNNNNPKPLASLSIPGKKPKFVAKIRAWTIQNRYRGHQLGRILLKYATTYSRQRNWKGPVFDDNHANSAKLLPVMFRWEFESTDNWARQVLRDVRTQLEVVDGKTGY